MERKKINFPLLLSTSTFNRFALKAQIGRGEDDRDVAAAKGASGDGFVKASAMQARVAACADDRVGNAVEADDAFVGFVDLGGAVDAALCCGKGLLDLLGQRVTTELDVADVL